MLLLDGENNTIDSARKVAIVAKNENTQKELVQLLRSRGLEHIEVLPYNLQDEGLTLDAEETLGVIIDIQDETNVNQIFEQVNALVPQKMWCCLIGNSDSISLAHKLLEKSILYFHHESQLNLMLDKIISANVVIPRVRHTVNICMLGCKGGIGSSFISSRVANHIAKHKKVPVLLSQGHNGSRDLDLMFDKKLQGDLIECKENLDLLGGNFQTLSTEDQEKYNFIIYDQPIFNMDKDDYSQFFEYSNTFVLIVTRQINSLRVAKQFLDRCHRQKASTGTPFRTFVVVVDSKAEYSSLMSKSDIESLLNCPVDAILPFLKNTTGKTVLDVKLSNSNKKIVNDLTLKIIGVLSRQTIKEKGSLLKSLFQKLLSNN